MPKYTITLIIALLVAAFFWMDIPTTVTGFVTAIPGLSYDDFEIKASWENTVSDSIYYGPDGILHVWFSVEIDSDKDLFYRVYDETDTELTRSESGGSRSVDLDVFTADAELKSLQQSKNIEVCISTDSEFTRHSDNILCKSIILEPLMISVSVSPDPVVFEIENISRPYTTYIDITNTGEKALTIGVFLPNRLNSNYSSARPQYITESGFGQDETKLSYLLKPDETVSYEVISYIYQEEYNATSDSVGYVWALSDSFEDSLFRKSFTLRTTVS